ncbi:hypothetical protein LY474_27760 [Myxococcus stipitatus]|uniref:DUF6200 domain-containing protein n=1 Tax=Myxococcus stipitatus TaxID=83455 RepID=UPI001F27B1F1|nr:hypothetical protein [Myxococcus stipitatus]MCE9671609.1 hypothetical protein [Myxococcus stipitatus]
MAVEQQYLLSSLPLVIDLGKQQRKKLKNLKRGKGSLMLEVNEALNEIQARMGNDIAGKQLVPVVFLYEKKRRKSRNGLSLPFLPPFMP